VNATLYKPNNIKRVFFNSQLQKEKKQKVEGKKGEDG